MINAVVATRDSEAGAATSGPRRHRRGWRPWAALTLLVLGGLALAGATMRDAAAGNGSPPLASGSAALVGEVASMPATPSDGVLTMAVPPGAAAEQQAGGPGYLMPSVIRLTVGDTIVLRNDDDAPHMILYAFLRPGETQTRTFTAPGSETYSSGCGVHAAAFPVFTTIFVSEPV
jgi:hypothetical protein